MFNKNLKNASKLLPLVEDYARLGMTLFVFYKECDKDWVDDDTLSFIATIFDSAGVDYDTLLKNYNHANYLKENS